MPPCESQESRAEETTAGLDLRNEKAALAGLHEKLILHSDNDCRVPLEQGEQWFRALKFTTEFVIFRKENHNLTRTGEPKHLVESLNCTF